MEEANASKMKRFSLTMEYDIGDHWESQTEQNLILWRLGAKDVKWISGHCCPVGWIGYDKANPSPGKDINSHTWQVECDENVFTLLALKSKIIFKEINE